MTVATQHLFEHCVDTLNDLFVDRPVKEGSVEAKSFSQDFVDAQEHCVRRMLMPRESDNRICLVFRFQTHL